jgi:hypothetical protein
MAILSLVLLILGFVAFVLAALIVNLPRVNLVALGLACWELAQLVMGHYLP